MLVLSGPREPVTELAVSPDGALLAAAGSGAHPLRVWSLRTGERWPPYGRAFRCTGGPLGFHPSAPVLFTQASGELGVVETDTRKAAGVPAPGGGTVALFAPVPGSGRLIAFHGWRPDSPAGLFRLVEWQPNGKLRARWSAKPDPLPAPSRRSFWPGVVRADPCGEWWLTVDTVPERLGPKPVRATVRSVRTGRVVGAKRLTAGARTVAAVGPGGRVVLVRDGALVVWDAAAPVAKDRAVKTASRAGPTALAFHPSGRVLAAAFPNGGVTFYDAESWRPLTAFAWGVGNLGSLAFSPDGALAAAGGDGGQVVVWDVDL